MTDDQNSARRPLGERDDAERQRPFGAKPGAPDHATPPDSPPGGEDEPQPEGSTVEELAADEPSADDPAIDEPAEPVGERPRIRGPFGSSSTGSAPTRRREPAPFRQGGYRPLEEYYEGMREPEPPPPPDDEEDETAFDMMDDVDGEPEPPAPAGSAQNESSGASLRFWVMVRTIFLVMLLASILATVFTWWSPNRFLPADSIDQLSVALATQSSLIVPPPPTATPAPTPVVSPTPEPPPVPRVGIVAGHRGPHPSTGEPDPGTVCEDGLTEAEVNLAIAERVVAWLGQHGYEVDLLDEFDPRLNDYHANALVSIHIDSCDYINDSATGFKVASFSESASAAADQRLVKCLIDRYGTTTGLPLHNSVTFDMTQYHSFREIALETPGAIIEVGFLYMDRELLTESQDVVALGVTRGILCYLRDEPVADEVTVPTVDEPVGEAAPPTP